MDEQTPGNLPPPNSPDRRRGPAHHRRMAHRGVANRLNAPSRQRFGARLAMWSQWLAIAGPLIAVLAWVWAGSGADCSGILQTPPVDNIFVEPSMVLYYGAVAACGTAVIGGGLALYRLRREPLAQAYRDAATVAIILGLLVGVPIVLCSPLFNFVYDAGFHGYCAVI